MSRRMVRVGMGGLAWFAGGTAQALPRMNLPPGVTPMSREIYDLHMLIFWICVAIAVAVFAVLGWSLFKYRKSRGAKPAEFHEHTSAEIVWTVVPFVILAGMAIPATKTLIKMKDTSHPDLTIQVTGSQWKWKYDYLDSGVSLVSNLSTPMDQREDRAPKDKHYLEEVDHPIVVPVNKKIRFLTTSTDVIHSWWVQDLGIKADAIPGFINEAWARIEQPGVYRGRCAELCGMGHAYMPIVVEAKSETDFNTWIDAQKKLKAAEAQAASEKLGMQELMKRGEQVFNTNCATCHQTTGLGIPGAFPALKGSKVTTGPLAGHLKTVLLGRPGTAMQSFAHLGDLDLAAVVTYERNAWGNSTGDVVQGSDVEQERSALAAK